jgi:hypothetical protein
MRHVLDLVPSYGNADEPAGRVVWDEDAGTIEGDEPLATKIRQLAEYALKLGSQSKHPIPSSYPITDPLRVRGEFAVVLAWHWEIPEWLADAIEVDADELAPGDPHGVDVIQVIYSR